MDDRDMQLEANFQTQLLTQEGMWPNFKHLIFHGFLTTIDFDKLMVVIFCV